ncbi:hypothetical protein FKW31_03135 [Acetobacter sp. DmW_136]|uniref:hypothetical protein n=1 Tax=Acetobacter sp. DmW_136 TaxID=2591091 RepID=UPI00123A8EC5|nr:hypothetical protein [Acetobacter sp. DmW_136]KAA8387653.1 hypothetical protein FKW31_03135 [Acetobacter sp. DmW_136]
MSIYPKVITKAPTPITVRFDEGGPIKKMGEIAGYAMVRRPNSKPFIMTVADFELLGTTSENGSKFRVRSGIVYDIGVSE